MMRAGLERAIERTPTGIVPVACAVGERFALCMEMSEPGVVPNAKDSLILDNHRTDHRVGFYMPKATHGAASRKVEIELRLIELIGLIVHMRVIHASRTITSDERKAMVRLA